MTATCPGCGEWDDRYCGCTREDLEHVPEDEPKGLRPRLAEGFDQPPDVTVVIGLVENSTHDFAADSRPPPRYQEE